MLRSPDTPGRAAYTTRLAAALAPEHLALHGPFVIHLTKRVVDALSGDLETLESLCQAVEALRDTVESPSTARAATVARLEAERFGRVTR